VMEALNYALQDHAAGCATRRRGRGADVSLIDCWGPFVEPIEWRPRIRIRCEYPNQDPTTVQFDADPSLGRTPADVHAEIVRRLERSDEFDLPAQPLPLPFARDTV